MKLLLLLSHSGLLSRRKAFDAICAGYVIVNGSVEREPSTDIDESRDRVEYSGKLVQVRKFEYAVLNKPRGYVTTCEGQFDQEVVMSLLPKELQHLRPVGRLDKDTEGLLLFTNDGELAPWRHCKRVSRSRASSPHLPGCVSSKLLRMRRRSRSRSTKAASIRSV